MSLHPVHKLFRNAHLIMTGQTLSTVRRRVNLADTHADASVCEALSHLIVPLQLEEGDILDDEKEEGHDAGDGVTRENGDAEDDYDDFERETRAELRRAFSRRYRVLSLCLSNNCVGDGGVTKLARAIARPDCFLEEVELEENGISGAGVLSLAQSLVTNDSLKVWWIHRGRHSHHACSLFLPPSFAHSSPSHSRRNHYRALTVPTISSRLFPSPYRV